MLAQFALVLLAALVPQSQPPSFRAVVLEDLGLGAGAVAINAAGVTVGTVATLSSPATAACWDAQGNLTVLGREQTPDHSGANGLNDLGVMVGGALYPTSQSLPLIWTLKDGGHPIPYSTHAFGLDINNAGDILLLTQSQAGYGGVLLERSGAQHSISGTVWGVSENGYVAGMNQSGSFRWSAAGGYQALLPLAGHDTAQAFGIGPDGVVCGTSWDSATGEGFAALWDLAGNASALPKSYIVTNGGTAFDVNAQGSAVGYEYGYRLGQDPDWPRNFGVLWTGGAAYPLEDLISHGPHATIRHANALNRAGQIVCGGILAGEQVAIRLDPL